MRPIVIGLLVIFLLACIAGRSSAVDAREGTAVAEGAMVLWDVHEDIAVFYTNRECSGIIEHRLILLNLTTGRYSEPFDSSEVEYMGRFDIEDSGTVWIGGNESRNDVLYSESDLNASTVLFSFVNSVGDINLEGDSLYYTIKPTTGRTDMYDLYYYEMVTKDFDKIALNLTNPRISVDGGLVAYERKTYNESRSAWEPQLYIYNISSSIETMITEGDLSIGYIWGASVFMRDDKVVWSQWDMENSPDNSNQELWLYNITTGERSVIASVASLSYQCVGFDGEFLFVVEYGQGRESSNVAGRLMKFGLDGRKTMISPSGGVKNEMVSDGSTMSWVEGEMLSGRIYIYSDLNVRNLKITDFKACPQDNADENGDNGDDDLILSGSSEVPIKPWMIALVAICVVAVLIAFKRMKT